MVKADFFFSPSFVAWCFSLSILLAAPGYSAASGYAVYTQGASALGQGNAVTAHLDSPSAIFFNPALIGKLNGTQVQIGSTFIRSTREFEGSFGGNAEGSDTNFPSTFFATHQLSEKLTLGLGVFSPFGLGTDWGDDWEGRYLSTKSELTTFNINPVLCWKLTSSLSVAAGLDYVLMDVALEKNLYLAPLPDAKQRFSGDGDGFGFNLGLALDLTTKATLGAHYRSKIDIDVDGRAEFDLPAGTPAPLAALLSNSNGSSSTTLPPQAQIGIAYQFRKDLTVEAGARWEGWSTFKSQTIVLDTGVTTVTERDWSDVYGFSVGGRYQLNTKTALLAGYLFDNNPAPDQTFDPSILAANAHVFSLGAEYELASWRVAVAYAYQQYEARDKNNAVGLTAGGTANGRYQANNHMIALDVLYRF